MQQQIISNGTNKFVTIQTDYVTPFKVRLKLRLGLRAQLRRSVTTREVIITILQPINSFNPILNSQL